MRKIGLILIMVAVLVLLLTTDFPEAFPIEALALLGICIFVLGVLLIIEDRPVTKGIPKYPNPPAPPKRKSFLDNHFTDALKYRLEAEGNFNFSIPEVMIGECYGKCGHTKPSPGPDVICLSCGSSIRKPSSEHPKFNLDRKERTTVFIPKDNW